MNEGREVGEKLGTSKPDSKLLHAVRITFVVLLIEATHLYINNCAMLSAFHALRFYQLGEQLLKILYDLFVELTNSDETHFLDS